MNPLVKKLVIYGIKRQLRRSQPVSWALMAAGGVGLGAAAIYIFDPERGPERRAKLRDAVARLLP